MHATAAARTLLQLSVFTAYDDLPLAKRQAALARKLMLRYNIRFGWNLRRFFCHGCKGLLYPGINARVRLGPDKILLVTCGDCSYVNRKKLTSHA